jgi:hypothetical protein
VRTCWTIPIPYSASRMLIAYMREQEGRTESSPQLWHRPSHPTRSCFLSVPRVKGESVRCPPAATREYKCTYLPWPDPHGQTWSLFHWESAPFGSPPNSERGYEINWFDYMSIRPFLVVDVGTRSPLCWPIASSIRNRKKADLSPRY